MLSSQCCVYYVIVPHLPCHKASLPVKRMPCPSACPCIAVTGLHSTFLAQQAAITIYCKIKMVLPQKNLSQHPVFFKLPAALPLCTPCTTFSKKSVAQALQISLCMALHGVDDRCYRDLTWSPFLCLVLRLYHHQPLPPRQMPIVFADCRAGLLPYVITRSQKADRHIPL